jgi:PAS domain-containing protein
LLNADGSYADASPAALELLGVTLPELLSSPPERFAAERANGAERSAFRSQWERAGSSDICGAGTIRRADGQLLRITFLIRRLPDGRFRSLIRPADGPTSAPVRIFSLGEVLEQWRSAERRLAEIPHDAPDWAMVADEVAALREQYHGLYRTRNEESRA